MFLSFNSCFLLDTGQDYNTGLPHHRIGPIAHSIVLGTLNVGDPGEAVAPDISRVCLCCYALYAIQLLIELCSCIIHSNSLDLSAF